MDATEATTRIVEAILVKLEGIMLEDMIARDTKGVALEDRSEEGIMLEDMTARDTKATLTSIGTNVGALYKAVFAAVSRPRE